jgi:peptidoglycan/LPS O-acetylase OafA/YrhL
MENKKGRIKSLQGLRTLAFCGIFLEHSGRVKLGSWGVACFLVMSGFLMYYNYCDRDLEVSFKSNLKFAAKRVRTLYPIHVLTFILSFAVYGIKGVDSLRHGIIYIIKIVFNLTLLQSWIPKTEFYFAFNAVSWYLSTSMALYFIFPCLLKRLKRIDNVKTAVRDMAFAILAQTAVSLIVLLNITAIKNVPIQISDQPVHWITYISPLYRLGDFYVGCLLGYLYKCGTFRKMLDKAVLATVLEAAALILAPVLLELGNNEAWLLGTEPFRYSLIYLGSVMVLVYTVACGKGLISRFVLSSKLMVTIGNISGYAFLFHQLFINGLSIIFGKLIKKCIIRLSAFLTTIAAAFVADCIAKRIRGSRNEWRFGRKK